MSKLIFVLIACAVYSVASGKETTSKVYLKCSEESGVSLSEVAMKLVQETASREDVWGMYKCIMARIKFPKEPIKEITKWIIANYFDLTQLKNVKRRPKH